MRYIPSIEDDVRDVKTYELADGKRVRLDGKSVREIGAAALLHSLGLAESPSKLPRRPVYQSGRKIGTLPGSFDPNCVRSSSWLYEPRRGDFVEDGDGWRADPMLGPGDICAVAGFKFA